MLLRVYRDVINLKILYLLLTEASHVVFTPTCACIVNVYQQRSLSNIGNYTPEECPTIDSGLTSQSRKSSTNAICTAVHIV